jgi:hypothetical protein
LAGDGGLIAEQIPLRFEYEVTCGKFVFEWATPAADENDANRKLAKGANGSIGVLNPPLADPVLTSQETEIFIPSRLTRGRRVQVHGLAEGDRWAYDEGRQTLFVVVSDRTGGKRHQIEVEVRPAPRAAFEVNDLPLVGLWRADISVGRCYCSDILHLADLLLG